MQYTAQYELLRSQVVGSAGNTARGDMVAGQPRGVGFALLLSEGMPGWLKTVETVLRAALAPRAAAAPQEGSPQWNATSVWSSSTQRDEVTTLLASLVLSTRLVTH